MFCRWYLSPVWFSQPQFLISRMWDGQLFFFPESQYPLPFCAKAQKQACLLSCSMAYVEIAPPPRPSFDYGSWRQSPCLWTLGADLEGSSMQALEAVSGPSAHVLLEPHNKVWKRRTQISCRQIHLAYRLRRGVTRKIVSDVDIAIQLF